MYLFAYEYVLMPYKLKTYSLFYHPLSYIISQRKYQKKKMKSSRSHLINRVIANNNKERFGDFKSSSPNKTLVKEKLKIAHRTSLKQYSLSKSLTYCYSSKHRKMISH